MSQLLSNENRRVLIELHALLRDIDPSRWRDGVEAAYRDRLNRIHVGTAHMMAAIRSEGKVEGARERLADLVKAIRDYSPNPSLPSKQALRDEWLNFRKRVAPAYEACVHVLRREAIQVPSLRPTNYARSGFHVFAALGCIALMEFALPLWSLPYIMGTIVVSCWSLEATRRIWPAWNKTLFQFVFFKLIAHPREVHNVNSATWYATPLFVLSLLQSQFVAAVALLVLGLADPAAAAIGRRWGRTFLINGRSLEGSLAFVIIGTAAALLGMHLLYPEASMWPATLAVAASAAVFGGLAELFSKRLDDNLTIPLCAAAGTVMASLVTGLPMWG